MDLTENQQVQLFAARLGHPLKITVALHKPDTIDDAIMLARAYEQRLNIMGSVPTGSALSRSGKLVSFAATSPQKSLTPAELAQCKEVGLCYYCDEKFAFGYITAKKLFVTGFHKR